MGASYSGMTLVQGPSLLAGWCSPWGELPGWGWSGCREGRCRPPRDALQFTEPLKFVT